MGKELVAKGQVTITTLDDAYHISQSVGEYVFPSLPDGTITTSATITSTVKVAQGNNNYTAFTIGTISKPAGFSSIVVDNTRKTVTYTVSANTTTLADHGSLIVPVLIKGITYNLSFRWAKAQKGSTGTNGKDGYTLRSSRQGCTISTDENGRIHTPVTATTVLSALRGTTAVTPIIGVLPNVEGCTLSKSGTTVTITFNIGTSLAEQGIIDIPITIDGIAFSIPFSYAKARAGVTGAPGTDANLLDWVNDWNTNKTLINNSTVITPKIFSGVKHSDGTLTGIAMGHFVLSSKNASGSIANESVNGIYGFKEGYKTFFVDSGGNAQVGRDDQFIKYNASTGKVEFGSGVSLNWTNAITRAKSEAINSAATDATNKINALKIGSRNYIRNSTFTETLIGIQADGTTISIDTANLYNGYRTLKVNQSTACTDANAISQRTYFTAINNKICSPASFSMYVKASIAGNLKIRLGGNGIQIKPITTNWQKITVENILPTSNVVLFGFSAIGTFWCALPMLVEGSKAVDWSPAPEDLTNRIADAKKAGTDARGVADAITNKANAEGWATKLTYIDKNGIFTGSLSANVVNALQLNASQITAGTIAADRIDINRLKAVLITAGNIEALTLNVTKGKIGGWSIDSDSIFRGTKNNTIGGYTSSSGSVTLGANGLRGYKWRLDATGAGALAGGNIMWDAAGNITFGSSVSLLWTTPINSITTALGGSGYPKVTKITTSGIYTGSITASQITAGTLSADRIASGSINASKLDAASIKSSIINTAYINGLSCTFVRGAIGGFTITSGSLYDVGKHLLLQANGNPRMGICKAANATLSGGVACVMFYYNGDSDWGVYGHNGTGEVFRLGSTNRIAGWSINTSQICKNNVYLGSDGSISNGNYWKLNNDGSGRIANGNISWNAAGTVTFSSSVSLNWTNLINGIQVGGRNYVRGTSCDWRDFTGFTNIANQCVLPYTVYCPDWKTGDKITVSFDYKYSGLKSGGNKLMSLQGSGNVTAWTNGFSGISLLPYIDWTSGNGEFHVCYTFTLSSEQAKNASFSLNFRHDYITSGTIGVRNLKIEKGNKATAWSVAPEDINGDIGSIRNALGGNSYSKLTKIDGSGIYTGTLTATQIISGVISADRIAAGSIHASKLDAGSLKSSIINTDYINGLSCTFVRGKIGGFTISSDNITVGNIGSVGATPLQIRSVSAGSGYWYTGAYKPLGITLTWHQNANAGHIVFGQVASNGNSVKSGFIGIQMMAWNHLEYFCLSANYTKSGGLEVYNRIAGWAFDNSRIWKNNVSLGSDGTIYNGEKWKLHNDGSGKIANGNISWNAAGAVTFSSAVSLNWVNAANNAVNGLQIGGTNLLTNTALLVNNSGWGSTRDTSKVLEGRYSLKQVSTGRTSNTWSGSEQTNSNLLIANAGDKFTASIYSLTDNRGGIDNGCAMEIRYYNSAGARITQSAISIVPHSNNTWQKFILTGTCPSGTVRVGFVWYVTKNGTLWVNGMKLERGTKATSWSASPYDAISRVTKIDNNGIYTGTINASQINAGTIHADRIAGGSIHSSKLDAASIKANIINTAYINGLSCTFVRGSIGGWAITSSSITKNSVTLGADGTISNGSYWSLNRDGSGKLAGGNIIWNTAGNTEFKGKLTSVSGTIGGFEIGSNRIGTTNNSNNPDQNMSGMFLYNDMIGFNATGRQTIIGNWNTLGIEIQSRLINTKNSGYLAKYGQVIEISGGTDRDSNIALSITGGTVGGLCPHPLIISGSKTFGSAVEIRKYNSVVWLWNNANISITLPLMRIQDHGFMFKLMRIGGGTRRNNAYIYPKSGQPMYGEQDRYYAGAYDTLYSGNDCLIFQFLWGVGRSGTSDTGIWTVNKLPREW